MTLFLHVRVLNLWFFQILIILTGDPERFNTWPLTNVNYIFLDLLFLHEFLHSQYMYTRTRACLCKLFFFLFFSLFLSIKVPYFFHQKMTTVYSQILLFFLFCEAMSIKKMMCAHTRISTWPAVQQDHHATKQTPWANAMHMLMCVTLFDTWTLHSMLLWKCFFIIFYLLMILGMINWSITFTCWTYGIYVARFFCMWFII